ncbi:hypothetical protein [Thiomicrorhabdus indica]|uniref:hypothetical protein n=1 Tax=Thiomicrorhabdus indica TaxID=2267253 RepID=UPI002AA88674|nr:hypothetical protein [Thiomicrorhabdus indica]
MTDDFDDLLDDVSEFEPEIETNTAPKKTESKTQKLDDQDGMSVVLETAKTAQEAATKSQEVAEANLKLAEDLKAQERELSEANFNWRQSFRSAVATLNKTKGQFVVMMAITLITCMIAIGVMSFLFYSIQQKEQTMKGEILDLLQNEQALFNKDMNIKVDQITAMMEMVQYQVEQALMKNAVIHEKFNENQAPQAENTADNTTLPAGDKIDDAPLINLASESTKKVETSNESVAATQADEKAVQATSVKLSEENVHSIKQAISHEVQALDKSLRETMTQLSNRQKEILEKLASIEQQQTVATISKPSKTVVTSAETQLNKEQTKQLKNIHWWVSQQDKAIKRIEKSLSGSSKKDKSGEVSQQLNTIDTQMKQMRTQQTLIEAQLEKLQASVKHLIDKSNESYSYKAKESVIKTP